MPGLNLCGFLTPPVAGADFLAALVASCFLGAFPPVDLRAVCLVRAMASVEILLMPEAGPPGLCSRVSDHQGEEGALRMLSQYSAPESQILC